MLFCRTKREEKVEFANLSFMNLVLMMDSAKGRLPERQDEDFEDAYVDRLRQFDHVILPEHFRQSKEFVASVDEEGRQTVKVKIGRAIEKRDKREAATGGGNAKKNALLLQALPREREWDEQPQSKFHFEGEKPNFKVMVAAVEDQSRDSQTQKLAMAPLVYNKVNQTYRMRLKLGTGEIKNAPVIHVSF